MRKIKYFSAQWCAPCKLFKPIMQQLQTDGLNIQFIDIDYPTDDVVAHNVRSVPTCVLVENNVEIDRWIGVISKEEVIRRYNQ
jgi:thioredoxin 1